MSATRMLLSEATEPLTLLVCRTPLEVKPLPEPLREQRPGSPIMSLRTTEIAADAGSFFDAPPKMLSPYIRFSPALSPLADGPPREPHPSDLPILSAKQARAANKVGCHPHLLQGLLRFTHGWYSTRRMTDQETIRALARILPDDVVIAGESAALLLGVDLRPTSSHKKPFRLCVVRPSGKRALRRPGIRCRVMNLAEGEAVMDNGVRRTSALRTAIDIAGSETIDIATHLFEQFIRRGLVTARQLEKRIDTMRGYRGVKTLRRALALVNEKSESVFETAVRIRLLEAGLPAFEPQFKVWTEGYGHPLRLDLGYTRGASARAGPIKLGVECDSTAYHPLTGPKAEADRQRAVRIRSEGWTLVSIRFEELKGRMRTFEAAIALHLGVRLRTTVRHRWSRTRWAVRHNAWVRD